MVFFDKYLQNLDGVMEERGDRYSGGNIIIKICEMSNVVKLPNMNEVDNNIFSNWIWRRIFSNRIMHMFNHHKYEGTFFGHERRRGMADTSNMSAPQHRQIQVTIQFWAFLGNWNWLEQLNRFEEEEEGEGGSAVHRNFERGKGAYMLGVPLCIG